MVREAMGTAVVGVGVDVVETASMVAVPVEESVVGQPKRQRRPEAMLSVVAQPQRSGAVVVVEMEVGRGDVVGADMEELGVWDRVCGCYGRGD